MKTIKCPKCGKMALIKYMPLINVPNYAQFQPVEQLAICKCGAKGKVGKIEMCPRQNLNVFFENMWTDEEIKQ